MAVARDIADRIEAQANLRRLAESEHARAAELNAVIRAIGDGIFVCDADGRISLSNPAAEDIFPDVEEETYAEILAQLVDPEGQAPALGTPAGRSSCGLAGRRALDRAQHLPGGRREAASGRRLAEETIVMLRDVTVPRRHRLIRDTFIGVLSHELRTPVTTIFAGSKVLARDEDRCREETRREIFSDIVVESERLHRLVEDVIAMTRFGEDEGEVGTEPVLIQRILPSVIRSEERRWPGVTFEMDLPAGPADRVRRPDLRRAGHPEPALERREVRRPRHDGRDPRRGRRRRGRRPHRRRRARASRAEEADRVFDLFFRSPGTSAAAAGAGIGLFVCARLDPGDGRPDLGDGASRAAARSSGSRSG